MSAPARLVVLVVGGLLVQLCVLDLLRVERASPDVALVLAAAAGVVGGAERGALVGFAAGLALDLAATSPVGLGALTGCLVGHAVGTAERGALRSTRWVPVLVVAAAGAGGTLLYAGLGEVLGRDGALVDDLLVRSLVVGAWNGALAIPAVPLVRWAMLEPLPQAARR